MIQANELRIGNLVEYDFVGKGNKTVFSIKAIEDTKGVHALNFAYSGGSIHSNSINESIEPIELTPIYWIDFGFEHDVPFANELNCEHQYSKDGIIFYLNERIIYIILLLMALMDMV